MALSNNQIQQVEATLKNSLRNKFQRHNPDPAVMPLHLWMDQAGIG